MNPKQASTQCNREHNNCVTALIYRIRSQAATERSKILNRSKKNSNQMAKHQQLSGELFFGNIRTNINTTHTLGRTHKFTLEIIKSQAAGRPISLLNTPNIRQSMVIIALITFNAVACTFFSLFLPICFHLHSVLIFRYMHFDFCYIEHAIILSKMPCNEIKLTFILVFSLAILKISFGSSL